ncbi:X-ray repair cross-complementing protein 5 [Polypterus senegalus]|uniref:X-ray repair cross-complementing protein 5 n=1 Tax=Polypterus senegalus TaxID=55291 RepID=UPI0019659A30|nr:X-ray repair cross-complementing protein 5 [Polypterus senegalus]
MARAGKAAVVLCLDVGFSMSNSPPGAEQPFVQAKKLVEAFVQRQVFSESKDELAVVLFGSDRTRNSLATDGQYQNIFVMRNLMLPDIELLEEIQNLVQPESQQADILDALVVCMDLLQNEICGKKYEKLHIAMFTDLCSSFNSDQLDVIIANLKKGGISLQIFLPFALDADDHAGHRGDAAESRGPQHSWKGLTQQQKDGLALVKKMMTSLDEDGLEEIYTFSESLEKLTLFKKIERKPMAWPCQLTIGSSLSIRIVGYKAVTEEKVKKTWSMVEAQTLRKDDVRKETVYCLNDDNETEIQKDNTIQGYRYGSDIVPFSKVDQEQMKYKADGKCFSVLGFTKESQVLRHQFMGNQVIKVFAPKDDEHAAVALSALIHSLNEMEMVAIVRYVYDRRCNPQVGAAFPFIKDKYECLIYVQLPYMEDLRLFSFTSLENNRKYTPSGEQLAAVDSLIESMMLVVDKDEEREDIFKVSKIPNPQFQRLFQCLHHRALNPTAPLPSMEQSLRTALDKPQEVTASCLGSLQQVQRCFPLQEAALKKEQKTAQDIFGASKEEPDVKKPHLEAGGDFNISELSEGSVTAVGSVDPVRDFRIIIRQKSLPFNNACNQLINRIDQLLGTKGTQYYIKSIACLQAFREESIKASQVELFNNYLQTLKSNIEERALQDFWELLVQDKVSLISKSEVEGSTVSVMESNLFLTTEEKQNDHTESPKDDGGDVDDLLDMM